MPNDLPISLTDSLFFATFLIATGGLKIYYLAWVLQETDAMFKLQATQRMRYTWLVLGTLICFVPVMFIIATNGWSLFTQGVDHWSELGPVGWVVAGCSWFGVISPLMAALTATHIYRHPCQMAKRVRGGWIATRDVRSGKYPAPIYVVDKFSTGTGGAIKRYVPSDKFLY